MSKPFSGSVPAVAPRPVPANLLHAVERNSLLAAVKLGLLPTHSYNGAWDALEEVFLGRYQPDDGFAAWLRENWRDATAERFVPSEAFEPVEIHPFSSPSRAHVHGERPKLSKPWMEPFLTEYVRNGGIILQAAKVARVNRDTVAEHRRHDSAFARAWQHRRTMHADLSGMARSDSGGDCL